MKYFSTILFVFVISLQGWSQRKTISIDPLLKQRIDYIIETDSIEYEQALSRFLKEGRKDTIVKKHINQIWQYAIDQSRENDTESAIRILNVVIELALKHKKYQRAVHLYLLKGRFIASSTAWSDTSILDSYNEALVLAESIGNEYLVENVIGRIAAFYTLSGEYEKAIEIQKSSLVKFELVDDFNSEDVKSASFDLKGTYNYIAKGYLKSCSLDSARKYNDLFYNTLKGDTKLDEYWKREYHITLGQIALLEEKPIEAENYFVYAYENAGMKPEERRRRSFQYAYLMGQVAFLKKDYDQVLEIYRPDSLNLDSIMKSGYIFYPKYYSSIAKSYLQLGDKEKADYYFDKQLSTIETNAAFKGSVKSKFLDIERKKYEDELQEIKNRNQKSKIKLWVLGSIGVTVFLGLFYRDRLEDLTTALPIGTEEKPKVKQRAQLNISESEIDRVIQELAKLERSYYFKRMDCTQTSIAKKVGTNTTYLSKIINQRFNKNFSSYLNDLRIEYIKNQLDTNETLRLYSIQSLANEAGYKSKESFNRAFRRATGMLPTEYIKGIDDVTS